MGHMLVNALGEGLELVAALLLQQAEMDTQCVQADGAPRDLDNAVQDTAAGAFEDRDVDIFPTCKGIHAEDGVAVIALAVDGVAAVGIVGPALVCQVFEMGLVGVGEAAPLGGAFDGGAVYFLQEYHVGAGFGDTIAHGIQYETAIACAIALVDVIGEDANLTAHDNPLRLLRLA